MSELKDSLPKLRVNVLVDAKVNPHGDFVLVWMTAFRRTTYNYTIDRAAAWAKELGKPILIFEPLRAGYRWSNDRIHRFVLQGMSANAAACAKAKITYYPYVEPAPGDGRGLLSALGEQACVVVTDDYPGFFLPKMYAAAKKQLTVLTELVDSNGLMPLRATDKAYPSAYSLRRVMQRDLPNFLMDCPKSQLPRAEVVQGAVIAKKTLATWPAAQASLISETPQGLDALQIDHTVGAATIDGGSVVGHHKLKRLLGDVLPRYPEDRNHPDRNGQSGLSPYLHFGHVSMHEIFDKLTAQEDWHPGKINPGNKGAREGFWGMSAPAEAFLDEAVTWRELGYNMAHHRYADLATYSSLPEWALKTLAEHADDPREHIYSLKELEAGETSDPVWNAAQNQLRQEGTLHNYMRMLWGKRVIAWTRRPEEAFAILEELNNKYGVDGRDPNSYSGIMWCFGRYDRPWPSHPIFGKVRLMTSASTKRKLDLKKYLATYS